MQVDVNGEHQLQTRHAISDLDKIHDLLMLDRRMTVRQIEETLGIPKTTVDRIMTEHLGLRKLSARWVSKLLTPDQKAVRRKLSSDNLELFEANPEGYVVKTNLVDGRVG
ncbi:DAGLA [Cordylochernes scorpioides]|uniref:DAGLA n=1 Tax=Cordylochernes scorpioides TaxID=51811 RepID=A0ABY6LJ28_9ARAC|nr:DAGLA [Cordylochernes scorpioides]